MANPFRSATELLQQYAEYHRDRRNIATHFIGVPMIIFGVGALLSRPEFHLFGHAWTPAWALFTLATLWMLSRGQFALGVAASLLSGMLFGAAHQVAAGGDTAHWLSWGLGAFIVGWMVQFVGHYYEGRKPAFVDDLTGLLVAPMFVALELFAGLGLFKGLMADIERHAGPTVLRDLAHPAT